LRESSGITMVETLVNTTIISFVALAMMSVLLMNYKTSAKVQSIQDNVSAVRAIKERIGTDVREGRSLGDGRLRSFS
jgi:type II secretory pathway pseudopilin PulG